MAELQPDAAICTEETGTKCTAADDCVSSMTLGFTDRPWGDLPDAPCKRRSTVKKKRGRCRNPKTQTLNGGQGRATHKGTETEAGE